jgi:hypothetical protein
MVPKRTFPVFGSLLVLMLIGTVLGFGSVAPVAAAAASTTATATTTTRRTSSNKRCDLSCRNDGVCSRLPQRVRQQRSMNEDPLEAEEEEELEDDEDASLSRTRSVASSMDYSARQNYYCQCRTGYAGALCEVALNLCPSSSSAAAAASSSTTTSSSSSSPTTTTTTTTGAAAGATGGSGISAGGGVCPHGSPCIRAVNGWNEEYYHCDCKAANGLESDLSSPFAIKFCEHASTVFCASDSSSSNKPSSMGAKASVATNGSFCVNGGKCIVRDSATTVAATTATTAIPTTTVQKRKNSWACACPDGYSGQHCEVASNSAKASLLPNNKALSASEFLLKHREHQSGQQQQRQQRRPWLGVVVFTGMMLTFAAAGMAYLIHHGNSGRERNPQHNRKPKRFKKSKAASARERAKIPTQMLPPLEIEIS